MNALTAVMTVSLLFGAHAPQQAGSAPLEPVLEARVQKLGKQLRCAVCQGLSITDSPAGMARAQMDTVRELVTSGKSDQEIRDYFVARYGEWALLEPPAHGLNLLVWVGPALLVLIGLGLVMATLRSRPSKTPATSTPAPPAVTPSSDRYLDAVRQELDR